MNARDQRIEDAVRGIMHDAHSIPVREMQRGLADGPPGDLSDSCSADDMRRFEWGVRMRLNRLVRSVLAIRKGTK